MRSSHSYAFIHIVRSTIVLNLIIPLVNARQIRHLLQKTRVSRLRERALDTN